MGKAQKISAVVVAATAGAALSLIAPGAAQARSSTSVDCTYVTNSSDTIFTVQTFNAPGGTDRVNYIFYVNSRKYEGYVSSDKATNFRLQARIAEAPITSASFESYAVGKNGSTKRNMPVSTTCNPAP